ncbi:MAG: DEAD/DEAH box helicase family protein [Bifidobacteriaceae bacterium]|jgi:type III restriction enzyme|nr:DEAD/DEAH box helicase family protein [Bifidobacteriaceae bacterium]
MLREPYTDKAYTYWSKYINNVLALRPPQQESLERFARIVDTLSLSKTPDLADELNKIQELFPTLTSFEREFPSVCFALATGIGKTRLMGALIGYLVYEKGVKNFFVMAPNLTIYNKLKADLGNTANPKYVFRGLDKFVNPPRIIDGDNYEEFRQGTLFDTGITINVFNISKLNSESGRMRRLNEVLGQSYFSYLQSLPDLCVFMDESHHYHADKGFDTINELHPISGVELTATPQIQKGTKKILFKNVVYEYSLAHALNDEQYVKVPAVFTRRDFHPEEYTPMQLDREKLTDGIRLHEETKSKLDVYARTHDKPIVKPFVLVVAKDTTHSKEIRDYLTSDTFFRGYYKDKVLEINSSQRGSEKDENISLLLDLESLTNTIEIVIHVNMLKEGWDVANLYTLIPLRASASETLTEQTIGRGLRLPYGQRAGEDDIDRLSIVSHDRYEAIVNLANAPDSLVRKVCYIEDQEIGDENEGERETVPLPTVYDTLTSGENFTHQLALTLRETATTKSRAEKTEDQILRIAGIVQGITAKTVVAANKQVRNINAINDKCIRKTMHHSIVSEVIRKNSDLGLKREDLELVVEKAIETCAQALTENVIPIPRATIQPHTDVKRGFYEFTLDTRNMNWHPSDNALLGTELQEGGGTFTLHADTVVFSEEDTAENEIVRHIIVHDNVDYRSCSDLIYSLIADAKQHFLSYLSLKETEKVMCDRQRTIAQIIYTQMNQHFHKDEVSYQAANMLPFTRIESSFGGKFKTDEIFDLRAPLTSSEVRSKIFSGFKKAGHALCKFDSDTERVFAIILETDTDVIKWLRPAPRQFNIYWGPGGASKYEPDFIVETADCIYMCEPKASRSLGEVDVLEKKEAAEEYCYAASEYNAKNGGKAWRYLLISHDDIRRNSSFRYFVNQTPYEQQSYIGGSK